MDSHRHHTPPRWAESILHWYCPDALLEEVEGDLQEAFSINLEQYGLQASRFYYVRDMVRFFNPTTFKKARDMRGHQYYKPNPLTMWRHYLITAVRNMRRQKVTSLTNVIGLTVGFMSCLLIGLFVIDEFKFDRHHPDEEKLFRVYTESSGANRSGAWASSSPAVGPAIAAAFPEVEKSLRMYEVRLKFHFQKDELNYLEENGFFAEPALFEFFNLPLKYGDTEIALAEPNTIVISDRLSRKYFGNKNPVGEVINVNGTEATVTAVLEEISPYFHLKFDYLISFETLLNQVDEDRMQSWVWQDFITYIKLNSEDNRVSLAAKLPQFIEERAHGDTEEYGFTYYLKLQPLHDIHLHSAHLQSDVAIRGNYGYTIGLGVVGLFLLSIALINFINLTTARAMRRFKEVGVRKAIGALKGQLTAQFMFEAILIVMLSMLFACQLSYLLLPSLNAFTGKSMTFLYLAHPLYIAGLLLFGIISGIVAGTYPAFVMSGFSPVKALSGVWSKSEGHVQWLRKGLVVLQFTLSILLIITVLFIFRQVNFLNQSHLGFEKTQLLHFPLKGKMYSNLSTTRLEYLKTRGVQEASVCFGIPGGIIAGDNIIIPGEERRTLPTRLMAVDHSYIATMQMEIVAGREFSTKFATDATSAFIINETAVQQFDLGDTPADAIGEQLEWKMWSHDDSIKAGRVIGVVRDFHYASLREEIGAAVMHIDPQSTWMIAIRLETDDVGSTIAAIQNTWESFESGYPFDYQFVDASFGAMYAEEAKLNKLLWIFTSLAIFIACIGAFGLATYSAERRRGEIGVRKILGASTASIVRLLTGEFIKLVLLACVIAIPISWYFMADWLQSFAYRISLQWWVFALAAMIAIVIAILTISFQSLRAATANPVNALREE